MRIITLGESLLRRCVLDHAPTCWPWVRCLVPWRLLVWLTERWGLCWVNVVTWRLWGDEAGSLLASPACWDGRPGEEYDYCGRYDSLAHLLEDVTLPGDPRP